MGHQTTNAAAVIVARLDHGADLLQELTRVARESGVTLGTVHAIGAVTSARLAFYDQSARSYASFEVPRPLEIAGLAGNVSYRDGEVFVHVHVTLSDDSGKCYAGHLVEGCPVFACEAVFTRLDGDPLQRSFDEETGLYLWKELAR